MFRQLIIRRELYEEEYRPEKGIPQQVAVYVDHAYPSADEYKVIFHKGYIEQGNLIKRDVPQRSGLIRVIFFVTSDEVALELANRWINEDEHKNQDYRVIGVDHYYSVFD